MNNLYDLPQVNLAAWLTAQGQKGFRATQVFGWLYKKRVPDYAGMKNLGAELQGLLAANFRLDRGERVNLQEAADGTLKFGLKLHDGLLVETVVLRHEDHNTACLSSQVGCGMGCRFCRTAQMGLKRNLTPGEMIAQVLQAESLLGEQELRNLVFMGMGEPFHNYENLITALQILTDDQGFAFSSRRITISTSGLVPEIKKFGQDQRAKANLAISLNGVTEEARTKIMPVTKRHSLDELIKVCQDFPIAQRERITFEYVMLAGVTDDLASARALVKLLHGTRAKVNLIPYNESPDLEFKATGPEQLQEFQRLLLNAGLLATIRKSRGQGILAACGQLAAKENP